MKRPRLKLRGKMLLGTSILVLLPLLLIGYLVNLNVYKTMTHQTVIQNDHIGELVHFEVLNLIEQEEGNLSLAAMTRGLENTKYRQTLLQKIYEKVGHWENLYYIDTQTGHTDFAKPSRTLPSDFDVRSRDWYKETLSKTDVTISPVYKDFLTGQDIITLSTPVFNAIGERVGVLGADFSVETFRTTLDLKIAETSKEYIWLIDAQNVFLYQPLYHPTFPFEKPASFTPSFQEDVESHFITNETYIPELGWKAIIAQDPKTALADTRKLIWEIGSFTLLFYILAIAGVLTYIHRLTRPIDALLERIAAIKHGACHRDLPPLNTHFAEIGEVAQAFDQVTEELQELLRDVITSLTTTLDARDPYTRHHSERVSIYAHLLAGYLGWSTVESENILRAGLMHDVGKIGVPEQILNKPGALTPEEFEQMKTHSMASYEILQGIPYYVRLGIAEMVLEHHERWDGKGYPRGLKDLEILPGARVLAIADAFDAMTSDRAYRKALSLDQALLELERGKGQQFDPEMVEIFLSIPHDVLLQHMHSPLQTIMDRVQLTAV